MNTIDDALRREIDNFLHPKAHLVPRNDHGVKIPDKRPRVISAKEAFSHVTPREAVLANFIPQMMISMVMQKATELVNHCRDTRQKQYLKHTRVIKTAVEEYAHELFRAYGQAPSEAYAHYVERYADYVLQPTAMLTLEAEFQARHQYPEKDDRLVAMLCVIQMIITFVLKFEEEVDKMLGSKLGRSCRSKRDPHVLIISSMVVAMAEDYGQKLHPSKDMVTWVSILHNRAHLLADEILEEEKEEKEEKSENLQ